MSNNDADRPPMSGAAGEKPPAPQYEVYFGRQPVLDRDGILCAFEMVPRVIDLRENQDKPGRPGAALAKAFAAQPVRAALTGHRGWLDVTREILFDDGLLLLRPDRVMFELPCDLECDPALIARLVQLHGRRFRFLLDHVSEPDDSFAKLLPYAEAVKIDLHKIAPDMLPKFAGVMKAAGKLLVAMGVESQEDFDRAHALGFDRFQGYYFAHSHAGARRVSAPRHALLNLLQLLGSDPTVAQLETELKLNPILVMHIMRLANSTSFGIGHKVTTLREAINATGTDRLQRWTQLLLYADGRKVSLEDDPLLQLAATRARFLEIAAMRLPKARIAEQEAAFLAGVFSCVDAVFGGPIDETIDLLSVTRPIRSAIVNREGSLGQLLNVIQALEHGDWARLDEVCAPLAPFTPAEAAAIALTAAEWAGMADRDAESQGLERIED